MDFPQTSLIPSSLALSKYFSESFPNFWWYPYWYLGNPFNYLIGPVVPVLTTILSNFLPFNLSYLLLLILSFLLTCFGTYFFLKKLGSLKKEGIIASAIFLILPFSFFLLNFQDGLHHLAFSVLPFIFSIFISFLGKKSLKIDLLLCILTTLVSLIDISILPILLIGFTVLIIIYREVIKEIESLILRLILIFLTSFSLATIWYSLGFWVTLMQNPSLGGRTLTNLFSYLFDLLLNLLPLAGAVYVVRFKSFNLSKTLQFGLLFLISFLFLSLVRFISDPDFILDWISYGLEIQFAVSIIFGVLISNASSLKSFILTAFLVIFSLSIWVLAISPWVNKESQTYKQTIIFSLEKVFPSDRVFLSGSTVFWANSKIDISQIRGGSDASSIHPFWIHGAYQIREGEEALLTDYWLQILGAKYILVNNQASKEFYQDFKNLEKYQQFAQVIQSEGNFLYQNRSSSIARGVDIEILNVEKPKGGADLAALNNYVSFLKEPIDYHLDKNRIYLNLKDNSSPLWLAVPFNSNWRLVKGEGEIVKDPVGNLIVKRLTSQDKQLVLEYKKSIAEIILPLIVAAFLFLILINSQKIYPKVSKYTKYWGLRDLED
ncbi:hypothetical protein HYS91_03075 [Candidatus Daviesbacteria bacterium]|nr:hypothetical protein [Candidatus Daviesbacteria bacterium]